MALDGDGEDLTIRRATPADDDQVLALLQASLGWVPGEQYAAFFRWKHRQNPFGGSPSWVVTDGDRIVGFRTFLRWAFESGAGPRIAVRAVDTATHPDYQGRGIFSRLTRHALSELREGGVDFVFNTPNSQSRPGYLKMGWIEVGRQAIIVRPASRPGALRRLAGARQPAEKWSLPTDRGQPAADALADEAALAGLLGSQPPAEGLRTRRTPGYLAWRYGFGPLEYRVLLRGSGLEDGFAVFRLRRRGPATEATVCDVVVPDGSAAARREVLRAVARRGGGDYALLVAAAPAAGYLPLPRQGPILTWRAVCDEQPPAAWDLSMGDVELF